MKELSYSIESITTRFNHTYDELRSFWAINPTYLRHHDQVDLVVLQSGMVVSPLHTSCANDIFESQTALGGGGKRNEDMMMLLETPSLPSECRVTKKHGK